MFPHGSCACVSLCVAILVRFSPCRAWIVTPTTAVANPARGPPVSSTSSRRHAHSAVMSPLTSTLPLTTTSQWPQESDCQSHDQQGVENGDICKTTVDDGTDSERLHKLCEDLAVAPQDLLRFESTTPDGVRGICLNRPVRGGGVILKIPLSSCLVDDQPPSWLIEADRVDPSRWATRLAARWLDLYMKNSLQQKHEGNGEVARGHSLWLSMLPDQEYLRASLPVHWEDSTVRNARSTALELAVDSAFFARAEAVEDLLISLRASPYLDEDSDNESNLRSLCHHALDLVQTRSCRLEEVGSVYPRRALAPVYDFINHGSRSNINAVSGSGSSEANAYFEMETTLRGNDDDDQLFLVVHAMRDLDEGEEVLIDYGSSARPAWKCLLSYGFVPKYSRKLGDHDDGDDEENLAEVYMMGVRYEVTADTIPVEMVAAARACEQIKSDSSQSDVSGEESDVVLTPDIALRIARRITDAAYHLLLEPDQLLGTDDEREEGYPSFSLTPFQVISSQLAASLRWSQHRVLMACADGLRGYATERATASSSSSSSS